MQAASLGRISKLLRTGIRHYWTSQGGDFLSSRKSARLLLRFLFPVFPDHDVFCVAMGYERVLGKLNKYLIQAPLKLINTVLLTGL